MITQKQKEGRDWGFYVACCMIALMFALPVMMLIDYILQEVYAPAVSARGPGHFGSHGINKHYRLARGR